MIAKNASLKIVIAADVISNAALKNPGANFEIVLNLDAALLASLDTSQTLKILPSPGTFRDVPNYDSRYCLPENQTGVVVKGRFYELDLAPYRALTILETAPGRSLDFCSFVAKYDDLPNKSPYRANLRATSVVTHSNNRFSLGGVPLKLVRKNGKVKLIILDAPEPPRIPKAAFAPPTKESVPGYNDVFCLDGQGTGAFVGGVYFKLTPALYSILEALNGTPGKIVDGIEFVSRRVGTPIRKMSQSVKTSICNNRRYANKLFASRSIPLRVGGKGDVIYFETTTAPASPAL